MSNERETIDIPTTTVFNQLQEKAELGPDVIVLQGATRSSKTYSICQYLIAQCLMTEDLVVRAYRFDEATTTGSIVKDFYDIMRNHYKVWERKCWNKTEKTYTFRNGAEFHFDGANDAQKLHGQKQDVAWLNEVMEIPYDSWNQIEVRTSLMTIMDYNPSVSSHWVFDRVLKRETGVEYIHSTYLDNEFLPAKQVARIEALKPNDENQRQGTANEWKWRVYGLGERAGREGRVYTNYRIVDSWPEHWACEKFGYGLDFGYTDPAALIDCRIFQHELYLREVFYETGLIATPSESRPNTPSIHGRMTHKNVDVNKRIYADSKNPDIIDALRQMGWNIVAARKGPGSIMNGIQLMQNYTIVVSRQSQSIIEELENYTWQKHTATGSYVDGQPIDEYNHALDAARYWAMTELMPAKRQQDLKQANLPLFADSGNVL